MNNERPQRPILTILLLIIAGESVFVLPFVLARIFRPTFLEVFNIDNFELGTCFSIYGIVAFFSYFFGGILADKFSPGKLMSGALTLTALGGFYMSTFPNYLQLKFLFGYFGFTTIFLFWAPMIKATRLWGGEKKQGLAFGFLDGGRGLVAASFGAIGVMIFTRMMDTGILNSSFLERQVAFKYVIIASAFAVLLIGILVYYYIQLPKAKSETFNEKIYTLENFRKVMNYPSVWLMMIIILCAYVGYKVTDIFSLYAKDIMGYDDIASAQVGTFLLYIRPIVGVLIGLLADRTKASLWIIIGFIIMLASSVIFASGIISESTNFIFVSSIILISIGVYATRVLYFALMEESKIPLAITGTAIGSISVVGYTPDIFAGPLIGILLDNSPGGLGHRHVFMTLSVFAMVGFLASWYFYKLNQIKKSEN